MTVTAIIPARGGSKGILRKNLLPVHGRPLIEWSIDAALAARLVDEVIVTTDDDEIAAVAANAGAAVPFRRPDALGGDAVPDLPVFQHAVEWLAAAGRRPEVVVHLRPTSPARAPGLIDRCVELLFAHPDADSVRSVSPVGVTPYKMWQFDGPFLSPLLGTFDDELYNQPRQQLPPVWEHDGTVDVVRTTVIEGGSMSGRRILGIEIPRDESADLDHPADLAAVETAVATTLCSTSSTREHATNTTEPNGHQ